MEELQSDKRTRLITQYTKDTTYSKRIVAKCIECIYDPEQEGGWKKQVEVCTATTCPLYDVRMRALVS